MAEQESTEALTVNTLKRIDLVQLTSKGGHAAIVWHSLRERDELPIIVLDNEAEPTAVSDEKRFPPLPLS